MNAMDLLQKLKKEKILTKEEFIFLLEHREEVREEATKLARKLGDEWYGKSVYPRGLVEFSNYCKNNCYYCGIRAANANVKRYRLTKEEIMSACENGYQLGYRSFVFQSGEDPYYNIDRMEDIVATVREKYPECAITLSIGELDRERYQRLFDAGAERYLLRHETANEEHYKKLHPGSMSLTYRKQCLYDLKEIGYWVGTGFMVGAPYQTLENIAEDLLFIKELDPHMAGIGPFIPHHDTKFKDEPAGSVELTTFLISILRIMKPNLLIPATTALGTIDPKGREAGILAGGNVMMPNLSPVVVRKDYELYDNKICTGEEAAECFHCLSRRVELIGYHLDFCRGDYRE
ncbi:MAG: [FeFe] hydrogenase H-cluster radical SAM maturase HydE [Lachnospiraceae bacterium]|nr:[FeFe] hydrogenase H-cluster radical SAM maturase HydE [Lachnospiraceae bacterium]